MQRLRLAFFTGAGDEIDCAVGNVSGVVVEGIAPAWTAVEVEGVPVPPKMGNRRLKVLFCGMEREERVEGGVVVSGFDSVKCFPACTSRMDVMGREVRKERRCWRCWIGVEDGTESGIARKQSATSFLALSPRRR